MTQSRVLIVSQRDRPDGFGRQPGYVSFTEAEDVLAACTDADLLLLDHNLNRPGVRTRRLAGRAARRALGSARPLPALHRPRLRPPAHPTPADHYDVAVFVGLTPWDLPLLEAVENLRRLADSVIVWFPEAWSSEFADGRLAYEPFALADAIFVGMRAAANELAALADCPVYHVPTAVDVHRFGGPLRDDGPRPIDVLGIGRRDARLHRALLDWARKRQKLYVYDTISSSQVPDVAAHRDNLADTYLRTNVALTNYAKYDVGSVIGGEREMPVRVWEAMASGALMAGFGPDAELQSTLIGEPVVAELPPDPSAAVDLIDELHVGDFHEQRHHQIRLALADHDWAHRWKQIFMLSGLDVPDGINARIDHLGMAC